MRKIGILGGSFNPVHMGHIHIAMAAKEEYKLDEVILMPAGLAPHKLGEEMIPRKDRLAMCEIAASHRDGMSVSDLEINSLDANYTYKTLAYLHDKYPDIAWYFIIGEDSYHDFDKWVHPEIISDLSQILVAIRSKEDIASFQERMQEDYAKKTSVFAKKCLPLACEFQDVSSTMIREMIENDGLDDSILPEGVFTYIKEHKLYQSKEIDYDIEEISAKLKGKLKKSRYQHTLGVMYTAANLAMHYSYPMKDAMIAGLLHDCAKYLDNHELKKECKLYHLGLTDAEEKAPHLLHAKVGAYFAKEIYHVSEPDILHAILFHTTGCCNMSLLDKILFVADYIEPNRDKAPHLREIRAMAYQDLDLTVAIILRDTISYLNLTDSFIDQTTIDTYSYYRNVIKERGMDVSLR